MKMLENKFSKNRAYSKYFKKYSSPGIKLYDTEGITSREDGKHVIDSKQTLTILNHNDNI